MDNPRWIFYWRLSNNSVLLHQNLFVLGLPPINTANYKTYSELVPQSQGGMARQGYIFVTLLWNELTAAQFRTLTRIVEASITVSTIYGTIDKADGTGLINSFIDISGVPLPLTWEPVTNGRGILYANVELKINNVVVTADPSTVAF